MFVALEEIRIDRLRVVDLFRAAGLALQSDRNVIDFLTGVEDLVHALVLEHHRRPEIAEPGGCQVLQTRTDGTGNRLVIVLQLRIAVLVQGGNLLPEVHVQRPVADDQQGVLPARFGRPENHIAEPFQLTRGGKCFTRADIESDIVELLEIPSQYVLVVFGNLGAWILDS